MTPPVVLTVAGSDPAGGAGIQADLRTLAALGVHGISVLSALTVQDTARVYSVHPVDADLVRRQLEVVTADLAPAATKTGLLATPGAIEAVAAARRAGRLGLLVVDPVLRASTGADLTPAGADPAEMVSAYQQLLLPVTTVVTPNLEEAERLTGRRPGAVDGPEAMEDVALELVGAGPEVVVVTGGHLASDTGTVVDVVATASGVLRVPHPRVTTTNTHGTGCTFSAAMAAFLAQGQDAVSAAGAAGRFVGAALEGAAAWKLGTGPGPLDQAGAGGAGR